MFAVLKTGGKQYRVAAGDTLRIEKLAAEAGDIVQFNDILMVGDQVGAPLVAGAAVQATVIDQVKGEKLIHFVRRRRKHSSKRTKGHRQQLTLIRVTDILAAGGDATGVKAAVGAGMRVGVAAAGVASGTAPGTASASAPARRRAAPAKVRAPVAPKAGTSEASTSEAGAPGAATPETGGFGAAVVGAVGGILQAAATAAVDAVIHPRREDDPSEPASDTASGEATDPGRDAASTKE